MARSRTAVAVFGIAVALVAACGGAVVTSEPAPASDKDSAAPSASSTAPAPRPIDAASSDVAAPSAGDDCACTEDVPQIDGTCTFTTGPRLIECVAERSANGGRQSLDLWRSCTSDAPPSWSPGADETEIDLCSCVPGERHALCVRYF